MELISVVLDYGSFMFGEVHYPTAAAVDDDGCTDFSGGCNCWMLEQQVPEVIIQLPALQLLRHRRRQQRHRLPTHMPPGMMVL
jgi:hypothetical protein